MRGSLLSAILVGASIAGCTPALDWREVRPEGSGTLLLFPCKPTSQTRTVALGAEPTSMTLVSCTAGGLNFALMHAELGDPARVGPALAAMRAALAANLGATPGEAGPMALAGMTPSAHAVRLRVTGRSPEGEPIAEEAALFARGTRVYQAAVLGAQLDDAAAAVFFDNLRFAP